MMQHYHNQIKRPPQLGKPLDKKFNKALDNTQYPLLCCIFYGKAFS